MGQLDKKKFVRVFVSKKVSFKFNYSINIINILLKHWYVKSQIQSLNSKNLWRLEILTAMENPIFGYQPSLTLSIRVINNHGCHYKIKYLESWLPLSNILNHGCHHQISLIMVTIIKYLYSCLLFFNIFNHGCHY